MATFVICHTANKLKHIALREIHYQLLNTCLIISLVGWRYCNCYEFSGCRQRPMHRNLSGEHNYCLLCQNRKTYNLDKIYKIRKIQEVFNLYKDLKKDLQNFLNSGFTNFWLYGYSRQFSYRKRKYDKTFALKNYINENYYNICYYDP